MSSSSSEEEIVRTKKYFIKADSGKENASSSIEESPKKKERKMHKLDRLQELEKYRNHRQTRKVPFAERKPVNYRDNEDEGSDEETVHVTLGHQGANDDVSVDEPSFQITEFKMEKASFYSSDERGYVVFSPSPTSSDIDDPTLHFSDR